MSSLYRVLYCSRNAVDGDPDEVRAEIESILTKSRANNGRDGVTGGLIFTDGCFVQVLEGPMAAVEATFERIQCDERHTDVTVLEAAPIGERDFGNWSMAFAGAKSDRFADLSLDAAFAGRSEASEEVLALMRQIVVREHA